MVKIVYNEMEIVGKYFLEIVLAGGGKQLLCSQGDVPLVARNSTISANG